jgi:hypothetical protein
LVDVNQAQPWQALQLQQLGADWLWELGR